MAPRSLASLWPRDINTEVNTWAMAGTWFGALVATLGLIGVVIQLQSWVANRRQRQQRLLKQITGQYAPLVESTFKNKGLVEGVAPSFHAWMQGAYNANQCVALTQGDRGTSGTSSWSRLLTQVGVQPQSLAYYGGPNAKFYAVSTGQPKSRPPPQGDLVIEQSSIYYGFAPNEFIALLIISGFSPTGMSRVGASTAYLGKLVMGEHSPLSLQAKFDPHAGAVDVSEGRETERDRCIVPVRHCVNYAVGFVPIRPRGGPLDVVIMPDYGPSTPPSAPSDEAALTQWQGQPSPAQLNGVRFNLECLVSVSGADMIPYNVNTERAQKYFKDVITRIVPGFGIRPETCQVATLALCALADLEPWPVLPVLQPHFVPPFLPLLKPLVGSRADTVELLQQKLLENPKLQPVSGWASIEEQAQELGQTGDISKEYFSRSASTSSVYYKSMMLIFELEEQDLKAIRTELAAAAVWELLLRPIAGKSLREKAMANMRAYLEPTSVGTEPAKWAVTVYAAFLYGWLGDYMDVEIDFEHGLKRRIFIG